MRRAPGRSDEEGRAAGKIRRPSAPATPAALVVAVLCPSRVMVAGACMLVEFGVEVSCVQPQCGGEANSLHVQVCVYCLPCYTPPRWGRNPLCCSATSKFCHDSLRSLAARWRQDMIELGPSIHTAPRCAEVVSAAKRTFLLRSLNVPRKATKLGRSIRDFLQAWGRFTEIKTNYVKLCQVLHSILKCSRF